MGYPFYYFNFCQISGDIDVSKDALLQVTSRLRANLFGREGAVSAYVPVLPYLPMSTDTSNTYESKDARRHGLGHSYPGDYGGLSDLPRGDGYRRYGGPLVIAFSFLISPLMCILSISIIPFL